VLIALDETTDSQLVVANDPRATDWFPGRRVIPDETAGLGPLAGLATALEAAGGASALVVAWDMPFVTAPLLRTLRKIGQDAGRPAAVVPVHGTGRWTEPLCAYYAPEALPVCRALLAAGERRAGALVAALPGARMIDDDALARFGDPATLFASIDSPEQLEAMGGQLELGDA
jgi:molybdopterin-guanine dinucleotide biosynthesis protein A